MKPSESFATRFLNPVELCPARLAQSLFCAVLAACCFWSGQAQAVAVKGENLPASSSSSGTFAFVEWNPAALKDNTAQVNGEYLILDGVAFGTLIKAKDSDDSEVKLTSVSVGATLTQYFFEQTLEGLFARGDVSVFFDRYRYVEGVESNRSFAEPVERSGYNTGASLGLLAGYRASLTDHITGSAGYGVIRHIPDFFDKSIADKGGRYVGYKGDWRLEVQVGLGVSF